MDYPRLSKVAIVGLGYVGLPLALAISKIKPVVAFDKKVSRIEELIQGKDTTGQLSVEDLRKLKTLHFSHDEQCLNGCDTFIVTVQTPINDSGMPDFSFLNAASRTIGSFLKPGNLVIYESTVYPGATREHCIPILEQESGLELNKDFLVGYSPERVNPGDSQHNIFTVKKITSGSNREAAELVDRLYNEIVVAGTVQVSSIETAEAVKIIENCQREINIAFANEVSLLLNGLNIDTLEVLRAAGTKWNFMNVSPGLVGGHCIGVDSSYLMHKAEMMSVPSGMLSSAKEANDRMPAYVVDKIVKMLVENSMDLQRVNVGVFGVAYKENVSDFRNSKSFDLADQFQSRGCRVVLVDDLASAQDVWNEKQKRLTPLSEISNLHVIILVAPHDCYRIKGLDFFVSISAKEVPPILVDLKGVFLKDEAEEFGFTVVRF